MRIIIAIVAFLSLIWIVYRDLQLEKQYTQDLRNRIVGSRLQMDGKLPYFYVWSPQDSIRYYDYYNLDIYKAGNITASPFLHQIITPIANYPQNTVSKIWLVLEYIFMAIIIAIAFRFAKSSRQRWCVLALAIGLLFTEGWKVHIETGQNYLLIPLVASLFFLCLTSGRQYNLLIAGFLGASLLLIRPNTAFFFLPFIFLIRIFRPIQLLLLSIGTLILLVSIFSNSFNRALWKEYAGSLEQQLKWHQELDPDIVREKIKDPVAVWEGIENEKIVHYKTSPIIKSHYQNGNFFLLFNLVFDVKIHHTYLILGSFLFAIVVLSGIFFYLKKPEIPNIFFLGSGIYMAADLASPIVRHQYYTVQFFFALLLAAALFNKKYIRIYLFMTLGVVLNIINVDFIKMEHSMGEYIIVACLLWLGFVYKEEEQIINPLPI